MVSAGLFNFSWMPHLDSAEQRAMEAERSDSFHLEKQSLHVLLLCRVINLPHKELLNMQSSMTCFDF